MQIVNGYPCFNCTDVDNARKNVDPAHPSQGPGGADKTAQSQAGAKDHGSSVVFGGALAAFGVDPSQTGSSAGSSAGSQPLNQNSDPGAAQRGQSPLRALGSALDVVA